MILETDINCNLRKEEGNFGTFAMNANAMSMERDEPSSLLSFSTNHPLEQFVLLAKGAKGSACAELIKQVLEAPGVHVFGELLEMPNIKEVISFLYLYFLLPVFYAMLCL